MNWKRMTISFVVFYATLQIPTALSENKDNRRWLCAATKATGFSYLPGQGWNVTSFDADNQKYIVELTNSDGGLSL